MYNATPMGFNFTKKREVERQLIETILSAYENKQLNYDEMKEASSYILRHIDTIRSGADFLNFIRGLVDHWKVFKNILVLEEADITKLKEQAVISKLSSYISSLQKKS